jgi:hypothetical protein
MNLVVRIIFAMSLLGNIGLASSIKKSRIIHVKPISNKYFNEPDLLTIKEEFFYGCHRNIIVNFLCPYLTIGDIHVAQKICKNFGHFVQEYKNCIMEHKSFDTKKNIPEIILNSDVKIEMVSENEISVKKTRDSISQDLTFEIQNLRDKFYVPFSFEFSKRPELIEEKKKTFWSFLSIDRDWFLSEDSTNFTMIFDPIKNRIYPYFYRTCFKFQSISRLNFKLSESENLSVRVQTENKNISRSQQILVRKKKCCCCLDYFRVFLAILWVFVVLIFGWAYEGRKYN